MEEHQPTQDTRKEMRQAARLVLVIALLSVMAGVYLAIGENTDQSAYVAISLGVTLGGTTLMSLKEVSAAETEAPEQARSESHP